MTSSASVTAWKSEQISCRPSARRCADVEAQVELRRRARRELHGRCFPSRSASSANSSGAQPLGALVGRVAQLARARRAPRSRTRARRSRARASARAPCAGARTRRARARGPPAAAAGPVRRSTSSAESTCGAGRKTVRETGRASFDVAGELHQHGRHPVGLRAGRRGEPVGDLALHHHAPERRPPAAPRSSSGAPARRRRRAGSRRPSSGAGRAPRGRGPSRRRSRASRPAHRASASSSTGSSRASVSTTCRCADARREVGAQDAEPAADLEHDVVRRRAPPVRPITPRMLSSTRKFWPSSRFGRMPKPRQALEAGARSLCAHHPKSRAALRAHDPARAAS